MRINDVPFISALFNNQYIHESQPLRVKATGATDAHESDIVLEEPSMKNHLDEAPETPGDAGIMSNVENQRSRQCQQIGFYSKAISRHSPCRSRPC